MATLTVNILPKVLVPPTVDAGPNIIVSLPDTSTSVTAVASDSDGEIVSYQWEISGVSQIPVTLVGANTETVTVLGLSPGTLTLSVTVTDNDGETASDTIEISVVDPNVAPVAQTQENYTISRAYQALLFEPGHDVTVQSTGVYRVRLQQVSAQKILDLINQDGNSGMVVEMKAISAAEYHVATIVQVLSSGGSATGFVDISFADSYNPTLQTSIVSLQGTQSVFEMRYKVSHLYLDGSSSYDTDNNIASYQWQVISTPVGPALPDFDLIGFTSSVAKVRGDLVSGTYVFNLTVTDDNGLFSTDTLQITVVNNTISAVNPPVIGYLDSLVDDSSNEISPLYDGVSIDVTGADFPFSFDLWVSQIEATDNSSVSVTVQTISGTVVSSNSANREGSGKVSLQMDLTGLSIGGESNKTELFIHIEIENQRSVSSTKIIPIYLYKQDISKARIIVDSESITTCETEVVITVKVPSGESRDTVFVPSSVNCTISPSVGTISQDTQYTITILGERTGGSPITTFENGIFRVLKQGNIEADKVVSRNHEGNTCSP